MGWLPRPLRRPYLLALSALLLLIAIAVEILRQLSSRHNGLAYYKKETLLSPVWQAWTNTPIIIALVALVLWEAFAQDALRLEPYFQLANPKGAPASVLFINYNFDAGILRPLRAARDRHWVVLCISLMSLLIRHLIPSLLSGLFALTPLCVLETRTVDSWPQLVELETQENWFSIEATYRNPSQDPRDHFPRVHENANYAIAPVSVPAEEGDALSSWTLNQSVYWSDMTCRNATVTGAFPRAVFNVTTTEDPTRARGLSWNLSSLALAGRESTSRCDISLALDTFVPFEDGHFQARYWEPIQFQPASSSPFAWNVTGCASAGLLGVMIDMTMTVETLLESNIIVLACQPVYKHAIANISLSDNSTVTAVEIIPSTVGNLNSTEFSIHGFQNLMYAEHAATGLPIDPQSAHSRVAVTGDTASLPLTQFQGNIAQLWNHGFLEAIDTLFNRQGDAFPVEANLLTYPVAFTVISQTAVMVEVVMVLGAVLLLALSYLYPRRPNLLRGDPSSIAAQCGLIASLLGPETLHALSHPSYHVARTRELRQWAKGRWCKWTTTVSGDPRIELAAMDGSPVKMGSLPGASASASARQDPMPHFLTLPWFVLECLLLLGAVTTFGLTSNWIQIHTLDTLLSIKFWVSSIVLVYGPTLLASLVYSLSNSLHRHLSVAEPWIRLRTGLVSSKQMAAPSRGPLAALAGLMQSGPRPSATIVGLSLLCLLNLILIVVSGGLFELQLITGVASPANLRTVYNASLFLDQPGGPDFPRYDRTIYPRTMDPSAVLPWTTSNLAFLPFLTDVPEGSVGVRSTATTRGIGTDLRCQAVSPANAIFDAGPGPVNWTYTPSSQPGLQCTVSLPRPLAPEDGTQPRIQYVWPDTSDCQRHSFVVSAAIPTDDRPSIALSCSPHLTLGSFELEVSPAGHILKHTSLAPDPSLTTGPFYHNLTTALGRFNQNLGSFIHNLTRHPHPLPYYLASFPNDQTLNLYQKTPQDRNQNTIQDLTAAIQSLYQSTFTTYITLHRTQLFPQGPPVAIPGDTTYTMWGLMPSTTCLMIIIALISVGLLGLVTVFLCYYNRYDAPRIPKAIGSLVPWVGGRIGSLDDGGDHQYHLRPEVTADGERTWVLEVDGGMELERINNDS